MQSLSKALIGPTMVALPITAVGHLIHLTGNPYFLAAYLLLIVPWFCILGYLEGRYTTHINHILDSAPPNLTPGTPHSPIPNTTTNPATAHDTPECSTPDHSTTHSCDAQTKQCPTIPSIEAGCPTTSTEHDTPQCHDIPLNPPDDITMSPHVEHGINAPGSPGLCVVILTLDVDRIAIYGPIPIKALTDDHMKMWCANHANDYMNTADIDIEDICYEVVPLLAPQSSYPASRPAWASTTQPIQLAAVSRN